MPRFRGLGKHSDWCWDWMEVFGTNLPLHTSSWCRKGRTPLREEVQDRRGNRAEEHIEWGREKGPAQAYPRHIEHSHGHVHSVTARARRSLVPSKDPSAAPRSDLDSPSDCKNRSGRYEGPRSRVRARMASSAG